MKMRVCLLVILCTVLASGAAFGAGFALIEQSVSGLGNAYAGGAASAEDATTIFFNPAGMTQLDDHNATVGLHLIRPQAEFNNEGSTDFTNTALSGGDGGDAGDLAIVPNLYYATELKNGVVVGVGVNVPFGLTTEYDDNWVGRYHAIKSELQTININPSVAYKFGDVLSVGAGFNIQRLDAELSNAIDFGGIQFLLGVPGQVPQGADGKLVLEGDSIAYGLNGGLLFEFSKDTTVGVSYRGGMKHDVEGTADFSGVPAALAPSGDFDDCDVEAEAKLPAIFSISARHNLTSNLVVMADFTRTNWSSFDELRFKFANGRDDGVTTEKWEDSNRYAVGATYVPSDSMVLRFGLAYDETPIPSSEYRTPRIPGGDRIWVALGGGFEITDAVSLDAAYAHLFINDPKINKSTGAPLSENFFLGNLRGEYDASVDIASVQLNVKF